MSFNHRMSTAAYRRARKAFMIANHDLGPVLVVDRRREVDEPESILVWTGGGNAEKMGELPSKATEQQIANVLAAAVATLGANHSTLEIAAGAWHLAARADTPAMGALEPRSHQPS